MELLSGGPSPVCPVCGRVFSSGSVMKRQILSHSDYHKRFSCFNCGYRTDRKDSLKKHCLNQHGMTPEEFNCLAHEAKGGF